MNSSFRLQITKKDNNFIVQSPGLGEVNEVTLSKLQKDLDAWKEDYSTIIETDSKFFLEKDGESPVLLQ